MMNIMDLFEQSWSFLQTFLQKFLTLLLSGLQYLWINETALSVVLGILFIHWIYIFILRWRVRRLNRQLDWYRQTYGPQCYQKSISQRLYQWGNHIRHHLHMKLSNLLAWFRPLVALLQSMYDSFIQTRAGQRISVAVQFLTSVSETIQQHANSEPN